MSVADFVKNHGGRRLDSLDPLSFKFPVAPETPEDREEESDLDYEMPAPDWRAITPDLPTVWRPNDWSERPIRFVDGCDSGDTIAWLRAPGAPPDGGQPVPVRLGQIGSVVAEVSEREQERVFALHEPIVAMVADAFPWSEIESFASALAENGIRFLAAEKPDGILSHDFEPMRKAAQNRSNDEMEVYEEAAIAQAPGVPTVVDGRLERRSGGFDMATSPVVGVIKTHRENYLHALGMSLLYDLEPGQRTPVFKLVKGEKFPVVSWYLRLSGGAGLLPNSGYVRVEVAWQWFRLRFGDGEEMSTPACAWVDRMSRTLWEYRCCQNSYGRAAISLEPIVRAEQKLRSRFCPLPVLAHRFYRLAGL